MCARAARNRKEPLLPTPLPDYPWQVVGSDLFELKGEQYLVIVDYFSRFPELIKMTTTTSAAVITTLKSIFFRYGIPEVLCSDNGSQYASQEFATFAESYGFRHTTSSPRYPQSNGQAKHAVQTVKKLLESSNDRYILSHRATPLPWYYLSLAELLMGRRVRTTLPLTNGKLIPKWPYQQKFTELNQGYKRKQKRDFNRRHCVR